MNRIYGTHTKEPPGILSALAKRCCGSLAQPCGPVGRIADARVKRAQSVRRHTGGKQRMRCGEPRTADRENACRQRFAGICLCSGFGHVPLLDYSNT